MVDGACFVQPRRSCSALFAQHAHIVKEDDHHDRLARLRIYCLGVRVQEMYGMLVERTVQTK